MILQPFVITMMMSMDSQAKCQTQKKSRQSLSPPPTHFSFAVITNILAWLQDLDLLDSNSPLPFWEYVAMVKVQAVGAGQNSQSDSGNGAPVQRCLLMAQT